MENVPEIAEPAIPPVDSAATRERWLLCLWMSPWLLLFALIGWHFAAPSLTHQKARLAWRWHRRHLAIAYSKMQIENQRSDLYGYIFQYDQALNAFEDLDADLKQLAGTDDYVRKERLLIGSKNCVEDLKFALHTERASIPLRTGPSDYCLKLINEP